MSYIDKMCFVNWRFRSFVQYILSVKIEKNNVGTSVFSEQFRTINLNNMLKRTRKDINPTGILPSVVRVSDQVASISKKLSFKT